jgi:hypothetical protein
MSTASRRSVITLLGLAPVSAAVGAEHLIEDENFVKPGIKIGADTSNKAISTALRNMADAIDRRDILTRSLDFHSTVDSDMIKHHVSIDFWYDPKVS